jgi:phosphoribosylamine-glycine ligase
MESIPNIETTKLTKTQLRRKRYEDKTIKKVCTLRAHPDKHNTIKLFAKTGKCTNCEAVHKKFQAARNKFQNQIMTPKWSDTFTRRDAIISIYTIVFIVLIYIVNDMLTNITS